MKGKGKGKKMAKSKITVAEVKKLAMANYSKGGDGVIECMEDHEIQKAIDEGWTTSKDWLKSFRLADSVYRDIVNS